MYINLLQKLVFYHALVKNKNWFDTALIVVIYFSYTNGCHEGFVEFCVIEVFKFWVILRWMKEGCKSLSLGIPWHPKLLSKYEQPTKLGDAPEWHPRFLPTTIGILLEAIFLFVTYYVSWNCHGRCPRERT